MAEDIPGLTPESTPDSNSTSPSEQHSPPVQEETLGISEQGTSVPVNIIVQDPSPIPTATLSKIPVFEESISSSVPISLAITPSISQTSESSGIVTSPETFTPVPQESFEQTITPSQTPSPVPSTTIEPSVTVTESSQISKESIGASQVSRLGSVEEQDYQSGEVLVKFKPLPQVPPSQRKVRYASVHVKAGAEPEKDFTRAGLPDLQLVKLNNGVPSKVQFRPIHFHRMLPMPNQIISFRSPPEHLSLSRRAW